MAEATPGTVINDFGKSLPTLEDFFYNDLEGYDTQQLKNSEKTLFYQEGPPQSADYLGISPDGSLLSIKLPKEAFDLSEKSIITNSVTGNNVRIDLSKAEYGGYANIAEMLESYKNNGQYSGYYATQGADNIDLYKRNGMAYAANMRLLYTNVPEVARFTSSEVAIPNEEDEDNVIIPKTYKDIKDSGLYHYSSTPYPYVMTYDTTDKDQTATCTNYKNTTTKDKYDDNDRLYFVKKDGQYYQAIKLNLTSNNQYNKNQGQTRQILLLNNDKSNKNNGATGYDAKNTLIQNINEAKDIRVVFDINSLSNQSSVAAYQEKYPLDYKDGAVDANLSNYIKDLANKVFDDSWYKYTGYVPTGLDKYHRLNGVIYVQKEVTGKDGKKELVWYNLNKMIIANANSKESPTDNNASISSAYHIEYGPDSLKPYTYNYANKKYVDKFWSEAGKNEDGRVKAQIEVFKNTKLAKIFTSAADGYHEPEDVLYNWTVALGDLTLFIPPESIRVVSQTDTTRVPVMRSKGTIAKGRERSMQYIELNLFFNEDRGINGSEYKVKAPNGSQEFTYKMNGFRALVAQMKFVPYLPVVNKYINEVLGIYAVCIENINVSTVPNFPKLLQAKVLLSKFNYNVFMPEIPMPNNDSTISMNFKNPFSACIDYDTMRWYYQRCILLGDELDRLLNETDPAKKITVNSLEFYTRTIFANRTALLPCHFKDPNISVYIADENHLKRLLEIKQDALKKATNASDNYNPSENEARLIKEVDKLNNNIDIQRIYAKYIGKSNEMIAAIRRLQDSNEETIEKDLKITNNGIQYKGKSYSYTRDSVSYFLNDWLYDPMITEYKEKASTLRNDAGNEIVSLVTKDGEYITIKLNTDSYLSNADRKNTVRESTVFMKSSKSVSSVDPDKVFEDSTIKLKIVTDYYDDSDHTGIDTQEGDLDYFLKVMSKLQSFYGSSAVINQDEADPNHSLKFLNWCSTQGKAIIDANEKASILKQSIDLETVHSLKYKQIVENALVTKFSATLGNTFARIGVTGTDGSAPQYMGGQDTRITWTIETKDEFIASTFKSLPELTAYYTRTYRQVLPTYPIKIDSEFTRLLGVQEITIDNVIVDTVDGFPGLYRIIVNAMSVDRTLRNKEALKLIDIKNQGLEKSRRLQSVNLKKYEDLESEFAKAEVYPDLELPKISELGKLGWRYIRYRAKERQKPDFFIDPDFYFTYPALTFGRALIEALRCTFDETINKEENEDDILELLTDTSGGQRRVMKNGGISQEKMNDMSKADIADRKAIKTGFLKQDRTYFLDAIKSIIYRIPVGSFDICKKIRCVFTEPFYINEVLKKYEEKKDIKNNPTSVAGFKKIQEEQQKSANSGGGGGSFNCITSETTEEKDKKVAELFKKFEDCAKELEDHLLTKDDGLSETSSFNGYDSSVISEFLYNYGFWDTVKKYGVFPQVNIVDEIGDSDVNFGIHSDLVKDGKIDTSKASESEKEAMANLVYLIQAAADALSGKEECTAKNKTKGFVVKDWQANLNLPYASNNTAAFTKEEDINLNLVRNFGVFHIKKYNYNELYTILPKEDQKALQEDYENDKHNFYVLDPYFRYRSKEEKEKYLKCCATNSKYCLKAFLRIMIWYMAKLIKYHVIPSIEFDIKRKETVNEADTNEAVKKLLEKHKAAQQSVSKLYENLKNFANNNGEAFDTGKFFAAILLAITDEGFGKNTLFDLYNMRNYNELNGIIQYCTSAKFKLRNETDPTFKDRKNIIRRYLFALYGYDILPDPHNVGKDVSASPAGRFLTDFNTKLSLEACGKPMQYMRDSFYDMVRSDYRGRMLRAFPTFYMVFADEGREIGLWKLHDNFYNVNAIHEIQIVKSRKIPADTCKIVLSNMFQTFTTDDEDCTINYKGSLGDLVTSFLNPQSAAQDAELRRLAADKINRAKLQTGVRIHVRMGYGSNASDLPCCFNGVIADIKPGELVEIVAQGDGVELCNPIYMEDTADIARNNDNFATMDKWVCGAPPKDILQAFLTAKGGPMAAYIAGRYRNNFFNGLTAKQTSEYLEEENENAKPLFNQDGFAQYAISRFFNNNPYGIRHFGNPDYREIFRQGEPAQNLYEITNKSNDLISEDIENNVYFGDGALDLDDKLNGIIGIDDHSELPYISFKPFGKTVWDIMHICQSINPSYITSIADFQFRSTIFLGKPHFYYAYKYVIAEDGKTYYEKRKPFRQWHFYNNMSDIVDNKISASSEKIKTNAVGLYEVECVSGMKKTEPMWVDMDIYPEYQKSMVVDTKLYGKSWVKHNAFFGTLSAIPLVGRLVDLVMNVPAQITNDLGDDWFATWFDNRGSITNHSNMAEDAVISALKNSMREMYQGYIITLGDPSVKPYDRMSITDTYENMEGLCDVREVIQTMNIYNGFTTTITPDAISAHKMEDEIQYFNIYARLASRALQGIAIAYAGNKAGNYLWTKGGFELAKADNALRKQIAEYTAKQGPFPTIQTSIEEIAKATGQPVEKIKKLDESTARKLIGKLLEAGDSGKSALKSYLKTFGVALTKPLGTGKVATAAKGVLGAGAKKIGSGLVSFIGGTAGGLATVAFTILMGSVNTGIYRTIKGQQVLYIFPMRKFGKAFTAGLDGQQGLVYGTVQFNSPGPIEQLLGHYFGHNKGEYSGFINFAKGLFLDEKVMEMADRFDTTQDGEFRQAAMSGPDEELYGTKSEALSGPQLSKFLYQPRSAYAMSLMPRAMVDGVSKTWMPTQKQMQSIISKAVEGRYYIDNIEDWVINPNLRNLIYIEDDLRLKRFFESGFLRTLPQVIASQGKFDTLNKDNLITFPVHMPRGSTKNVVGVKRKETNKKDNKVKITLDVPYLSDEGIVILKELCQHILQNSEYLKEPDSREIEQSNKDTSLIISSALIVGSQNKLYGSGFHIMLTGTGKLGEDGVLKGHVEEYRKILQEALKSPSAKYERLPLFTIDQKVEKLNEVGIDIAPLSPFANNMALTDEEMKNVSGSSIKSTDKEKSVDCKLPTKSEIENKYTDHVHYSDLDEPLKRCGEAYTKLTYNDIVRSEPLNRDAKERQSVYPSGWKDKAVTGQEIYQRCHLIAHSMQGDEGNVKNLITGTSEFNQRMLVHETQVKDYLKNNKNATVLYKVTPVYEGDNLVASYVIMEATDITDPNNPMSIFGGDRDDPKHYIVYNTQDGYNINYKTGNLIK